MSKIGIGVVAFDRPAYLRQCLESIYNQKDDNLEVYVFLDGVINKFSKRTVTTPEMVGKSKQVVKRFRFNVKERRENVGVAINQFEAIEFLANKYDNFIIVEDDVVLSPHYTNLIRKLYSQMTEDVFSVSLGFKHLCKPMEVKKHLKDVVVTNKTVGSSLHWWAEGYKSENWFKVRDYFLEYYEHVKNVDYKLRKHNEIREMYRSYGFDIPQTSQDGGRDFALYRAGMVRLNTVVARAKYIGKFGLHFTPRLFTKMGYSQDYQYIFEEDKTLEAFNV